ncbi:MAG TPA: ribonuclease E activity regulator RraA [Xanthomonadaceae bacterium]|nr:ribonuclease E activity regulator RraA [Xanthomonadaceae bacterium]
MPAVADLSDAHPDCLIAAPGLFDFGGRRSFHGPIRTLKVFEDNALVRAALEQPGAGAVLVVDGGGSLRCALVGGLLGEMAVKHGWAGLIVHGCVRDSVELAMLPLGVRALAACPRKSAKGTHGGQPDLPVEFLGIRWLPGAWAYADEDGILVSPQKLHAT